MKTNNQKITIYSVAEKLAGNKQPVIGHFQEAKWLVEYVLKKSINSDQINLSDDQLKELEKLISARIDEHKPLGYLLGNVPFCGLLLETCQPILLPRMETEEWSNHLIERLKKSECQKLEILDLCTGSGCIALALAKAFPEAIVTGSDINPKAIKLASKNANLCNIANAKFLLSDLFNSIPEESRFDLIVANPPYISEDEWASLSDDVKLWEDKNALLAENNGLEFYEKIIDQAELWLKPDGLGWLILEIGHKQAEAVSSLLIKQSFEINQIFTDSFGLPRAIFSKKTK